VTFVAVSDYNRRLPHVQIFMQVLHHRCINHQRRPVDPLSPGSPTSVFISLSLLSDGDGVFVVVHNPK
jgi:hypothetical protein